MLPKLKKLQIFKIKKYQKNFNIELRNHDSPSDGDTQERG